MGKGVVWGLVPTKAIEAAPFLPGLPGQREGKGILKPRIPFSHQWVAPENSDLI
jgi:hypothetical protein